MVLKILPLPDVDYFLACDTFAGNPGLFVSFSITRMIFTHLHSVYRPGIRDFVSKDRDVRIWAGICIPCQRSRIHRYIQSSSS